MFDKKALYAQVQATLEQDRQVIAEALQAAHEAATHSENKAENKYDTRGLEAAYLADGQRRRLADIDHALQAWRQQSSQPLTVVRLGALVQLSFGGQVRWVLLGPAGAGIRVQQMGQEVLLISPQSPMGRVLLGLTVDDEFQLPAQLRVGQVLAVH